MDKIKSREIGFSKEKEAVTYLQKSGYKIVATNFITKFGEIDIIAKDKKDLVFIEVKYRKTLQAGTPQEAVNISKQKKIIKAAIIYLQQNNITANFRFDIVAIENSNINLIKAAFSISESKYYF